MCGRFAIAASLSAICAAFRLETALTSLEPVYNAAPTMTLPIIVRNRLGLAQWGFPGPAGQKPLFNARMESIATKPTFAPLWQAGRRCIVPASGFYEWDSAKKPWFVTLDGNDIIGFAGLWTRDPANNAVRFVILTTAATGACKTIHERMPVMLTPDQAPAWFDGQVPPLAAQVDIKLANPAVGSIRNNTAALLAG